LNSPVPEERLTQYSYNYTAGILILLHGNEKYKSKNLGSIENFGIQRTIFEN
jgi:hypothetical protein